MKPRRDKEEHPARRLMEETPQEPVTADPDEEGEAQEPPDDDGEEQTPA